MQRGMQWLVGQCSTSGAKWIAIELRTWGSLVDLEFMAPIEFNPFQILKFTLRRQYLSGHYIKLLRNLLLQRLWQTPRRLCLHPGFCGINCVKLFAREERQRAEPSEPKR
jgi:hypothetical protein